MADITSALVEIDGRVTVDRLLAIAELSKRDGYKCTYPGCKDPLTTDESDDHFVTLDHIYPQSKCKAEGWSFEEIWALDNLQLMGRRCNARKGDAVYNEDGTLPVRGRVRVPKAERPTNCDTCLNGRILMLGEVCPDCNSGPQPSTAPKTLQVPPKECSHGWGEHPEQYCWMCFIGHVERPKVEAPGSAFGESL
jgi:hypothetical protein